MIHTDIISFRQLPYKMKLKLSYFKCWQDSEFEFLDGKLTLIRGHSGVGKTTIFTAIDWVLYGKRRNIEPISPPGTTSNHAKSTLVTSVMLEIPGVAIYRQRNPRLLQFRINNVIYTDDEAQALICKYFGDQDVWMATSVLWQNDRNSFLSSSNQEKMSLLRKLVFGTNYGNDEGPATSYVQTLLNAQTQLQQQQLILNSRCTELQNSYQQRSSGIDWSMAKKEPELEAMRRAVSELRLRIGELLKVQQQRQVELGVIDNMEVQLRQCKLQLQQLVATETREPNIIADIETLNGLSIQIVNDATQLLRDRERLSSLMATVSPIDNLPTDASILQQLLADSERQQQLYQQNVQLARVLNVNYDESSRKDALIDVERYLAEVPLLNIYQRIKSLKDNLLQANVQLKERERELENVKKYLVQTEGDPPVSPSIPTLILPDKLTEDDMARLFPLPVEPNLPDQIKIQERMQDNEVKIRELSRAHDAIACPSCQASLFYEGGKLTQYKRPDVAMSIDDLRAENAKLLAELKQIRDAYDLYQREVNLVNRQRQDAVHNNATEIEVAQLRHQATVDMQQRDFIQKSAAWENAKMQTQRLLSTSSNSFEQSKKHVTDITAHIDSFLQQLQEQHGMNYQQLVDAVSKISGQQMDLSMLQQRKRQLESLTIVDAPTIGAESIRKQIEYINVKDTFDKVIKRLQDFPINLDGWSIARLETATVAARRYMAMDIQRQQLEQNIKQLEKNIADKRAVIPGDPGNDITNCQQDVQRKEYLINYAVHVNGLLAEFEYIRSQVQTLSTYNARLAAMERMKAIALERECSVLQERIDIINYSLARITAKLFDTPIAIRLQLYKELKTVQMVRPCVNFNIIYQGGEFDNINQLSGGEGDRISLAFTLALALTAKSPIILLDECFSALNSELKQRGIRTLSKLGKCKTILVICHESVEGFFDAVVNVGGETTYNSPLTAALTF